MTIVIKIVLVGKMRSGKDAIGTLLTTRHGFNPPFAFGTALKASAHDIFPDVPRTPKPRALYQFMNVMREYDPQVWIKHVERSVAWALDSKKTQGIVITDARQANEIEWARANGFKIVRVTAPESVRIARAQAVGDVFDYEALTHLTETEVDGFDVDYTLENDGDYDSLVAKVDALMAEIKRGQKRLANKGDIIRIIRLNDIHEPYEIGDVFEVKERWQYFEDDCGVTTLGGIEILDSEYEVIRWSE